MDSSSIWNGNYSFMDCSFMFSPAPADQTVVALSVFGTYFQKPLVGWLLENQFPLLCRDV